MLHLGILFFLYVHYNKLSVKKVYNSEDKVYKILKEQKKALSKLMFINVKNNTYILLHYVKKLFWNHLITINKTFNIYSY